MKKLINKNVIKAMTIGISALMAANSMNLTAFAAEGDSQPVNSDPALGGAASNPNEVYKDKTDVDAFEAAKEEAQSLLDAALETIGTDTKKGVKDDVEAATQDVQDILNQINNETDSDLINNAIDKAAEKLEGELDNDNLDDKNLNEDGTPKYKTEDDKVDGKDVLVDANEAIGDVNTALNEIAKNKQTVWEQKVDENGIPVFDENGDPVMAQVDGVNGEINYAIQDAINAEDAADAAADAAVNAITDAATNQSVEEVVDDAFIDVNTAIDNIRKAATPAEAEGLKNAAIAAIDKVAGVVSDADVNFKLAEADYVQAETDLGNAVAKYEEAVAKWEGLRATANADLEACEAELGLLKADVDELTKKVNSARSALAKNGLGKIADLEKKIEGKETPSWKSDYRELAKAIVEFYIIPSEGGIVIKDAKQTYGSVWYDSWVDQYGKNYTYSNNKEVSPVGDVLNYGIVRYNVKDELGNLIIDEKTQEPVVKTLIYNYKTAEGNDQSSKGGIVIFEKTKHNVIGAEEITDEVLAKLDAGEAVFDDVNNAKTFLVKEGDKYVRYNIDETKVTDEDTTTYVTEGTTSKTTPGSETTDLDGAPEGYQNTKKVDTKTVVTTKVEIVDGVVYTYSYDGNGNVIKTKTANVKTTTTTDVTTTTTETTFTGAQLKAQAEKDYSTDENVTKKAYLDALRDMISKLEDGQVAIYNGNEYTNESVIPDNADAVAYGYEKVDGEIDGTEPELYGYSVNVTYSSKFSKTVGIYGDMHLGIVGALWGDSVWDLQKALVNKEINDFKNSLDTNTYKYTGCKDNTTAHAFLFSEDYVDGNVVIKYETIRNLSSTKTITTTLDENQAKNSAKTAVLNDASNTTELKETRTIIGATATPLTRNKDIKIPTYGYAAVDYILKTVKVDTVTSSNIDVKPENKKISETVIAIDNVENKVHSSDLVVEYRNDNWYTGNVLLAEYSDFAYGDKKGEEITFTTDGLQPGSGDVNPETNVITTDKDKTTAFRNEVSAVRAKLDQYDNIISKINDAKNTIAAANKAIDGYEDEDHNHINGLKDEINALKYASYKYSYGAWVTIDGQKQFIPAGKAVEGNEEVFFGEDEIESKIIINKLIAAQEKLEEAERILEAAKSKLADLQGRKADLDREFASRVTELTPAPTTPADEGGADEGGAVDGGAAVVLGAPAAPAAPAAPVVVADGGVAVDDGVAAPVITEEIGDEAAALAETIPTDEKKIYDIIDDPTALAELIEEPGVHIGWWWWLLIIAALGVTGWALYRKYKKNKAAEENGGKKDQK